MSLTKVSFRVEIHEKLTPLTKRFASKSDPMIKVNRRIPGFQASELSVRLGWF